MSVHDDLTSVQRCLDDLQRSVRRLEQQMGTGLEMRRVRADADHLRESLALLRESTAARAPGLPAVPGPAGAVSGSSCPTWCPSPTPRTTAPCGPIPTTRVSARTTVPPTSALDTGAPPNPTGVRSWPLVRNLI